MAILPAAAEMIAPQSTDKEARCLLIRIGLSSHDPEPEPRRREDESHETVARNVAGRGRDRRRGRLRARHRHADRGVSVVRDRDGLAEHMTIGLAFVGVSLARGYLLRRLFERLR